LILPWAAGAGSNTVFSLAPLAAAAWAQSGFCKPLTTHNHFAGSLQFVWPSIEARVELPAAGLAIAPATPAPVAAAAPPATVPGQPMRVRLATPLVVRRRPNLEGPIPTPVEEPRPQPVVTAAPAPGVPRRSLFATIF